MQMDCKKMRFTIERANLLKTLSHVQSIVEKRNTIPVLSNVRIEALGDGISFKATDMDTEITEMADAKIMETGATTAPAHMLYDIVRKLSDGSQVELIYPDDKGQLTISAGKSKFSISSWFHSPGSSNSCSINERMIVSVFESASAK